MKTPKKKQRNERGRKRKKRKKKKRKGEQNKKNIIVYNHSQCPNNLHNICLVVGFRVY